MWIFLEPILQEMILQIVFWMSLLVFQFLICKPPLDLISGLVREGLQTLPVVGTIVTAFKEDTVESPKGNIQLSKWHLYRLAVGLIIAYFLAKGLCNEEQIDIILTVIGI